MGFPTSVAGKGTQGVDRVYPEPISVFSPLEARFEYRGSRHLGASSIVGTNLLSILLASPVSRLFRRFGVGHNTGVFCLPQGRSRGRQPDSLR